MPVSVTVSSDRGVVIVRDASFPLPEAPDQAAFVGALEAEARLCRLFFLVADDPVRYRVDIYAAEAVPAALDRGFVDLTGSFLLDVPSGRLAVSGYGWAAAASAPDPVLVARGRHLLTVMGRRPFDGKRYDEDIVNVVGAHEWKFARLIDRLGLLGCLPMVATLATMFLGRWHWLWYVLPILVVSWLPYVVLTRTPRYRATRRRTAEHERRQPHFILRLTPTEQGEPLRGGFIRV
jgi:hypothetical protein